MLRRCRACRMPAQIAKPRGAMTALEQLGAFVATYTPDDRARAEVRLHAADTIGAWIAACGTAEGRALLAFRKADATRWPTAWRSTARWRGLSEIDDIHLGAMITPGAIVVPAALTIAASLPGRSGRRSRRRHRRGLRGHGPARRRDRRAERALSRHLAELFRGAVRRRRGRRAAAAARRASRPRMRSRPR